MIFFISDHTAVVLLELVLHVPPVLLLVVSDLSGVLVLTVETVEMLEMWQRETWLRPPGTSRNELGCCVCSLATAELMTSQAASSPADGGM